MFVQGQKEHGVLPLVRAGEIANAAMEQPHADPSCRERLSEDRCPGRGVCSKTVRPEGRVMAPFFERGDLRIHLRRRRWYRNAAVLYHVPWTMLPRLGLFEATSVSRLRSSSPTREAEGMRPKVGVVGAEEAMVVSN